jgi:hypothetical protein
LAHVRGGLYVEKLYENVATNSGVIATGETKVSARAITAAWSPIAKLVEGKIIRRIRRE